MIDATEESILQEAHRLTHGARNNDYGHPLDDYTRTAALVSALLAHKLKEPISAEEMALAMCCVKMSRQVHMPKRDNMTDLAGYAWVSFACAEERVRRDNPNKPTTLKEIPFAGESPEEGGDASRVGPSRTRAWTKGAQCAHSCH